MKPPQNDVLVQNDFGSSIPPRSIVVVISTSVVSATSTQEMEVVSHVTQYTGQAGNILVTGLSPIASGGQGTAYYDGLIDVAIDSAVAVPLVGEQWGPVPNTWTVGRGGMGFFAHATNTLGTDPKRSVFLRGKGWCWVKCAAIISAGSNAGVAFTVDVWHYDNTSGATPKPLIVSPNAALLGLTAYNYDASMSAVPIGTVGKMEESQGIRTVYWMGCNP